MPGRRRTFLLQAIGRRAIRDRQGAGRPALGANARGRSVSNKRWMPCGCGARLIEHVVDRRSYGAVTLDDLYCHLAGLSTEHDIAAGKATAPNASIVREGGCHPPTVVDLGN